MRVIAGAWRGRPLVAPAPDKAGGAPTTRPTADRTREALFSMLTSRLGDFAGLKVLDLFAGSGALGLEALSRGAGYCLFVEQDAKAVAAIRANLARLAPEAGRAQLLHQSVLTLTTPPTAAAGSGFDLILIDPPYRTGAGVVALERLLRLGWVAPHAWISVETEAKESVAVEGLVVDAERNHGKAKLTLLRRE